MNLKDKNEEKLIEQMVREVGLEKPSASLLTQILNQVEYKKKIVYQPLMSKKGWSIVSLTLIGSAVLLYIFPTESISFLSEISLLEISVLQNPFNGLEVSKASLYSIGFLSLFLLQILVLKRYFDKHFS